MNSLHQPLSNHYPAQNLSAEKKKKDDDAFEGLINDYVSILQNTNEFGLAYARTLPFQLTLTANKLELQSMLAVNRSGQMIVHDRALGLPEVATTLPVTSFLEYFVFVEIHDRQGWNAPTDNRLQPQFRIPTYQLIAQPVYESVNEFTNAICIGKVMRVESSYQLCQQFIPASMHLYAHKLMAAKLEIYKNKWQLWQLTTGHMIRQTIQVPHDAVLSDVNRLASAVGIHFSQQKSTFNNLSGKSHPFELIKPFMELAGIIQYHFQELSPQKDLLLKFFSQYTAGTPDYHFNAGHFIQSIQGLADYQFDQQNLTEAFLKVDDFIKIVGRAWELLNEVRTFGITNFNTPIQL